MNKYDVIIIGAGPSGIFCAYELMRQKPKYFQRKAGSIYKRGQERMAGQTDRCCSWI